MRQKFIILSTEAILFFVSIAAAAITPPSSSNNGNEDVPSLLSKTPKADKQNPRTSVPPPTQESRPDHRFPSCAKRDLLCDPDQVLEKFERDQLLEALLRLLNSTAAANVFTFQMLSFLFRFKKNKNGDILDLKHPILKIILQTAVGLTKCQRKGVTVAVALVRKPWTGTLSDKEVGNQSPWWL